MTIQLLNLCKCAGIKNVCEKRNYRFVNINYHLKKIMNVTNIADFRTTKIKYVCTVVDQNKIGQNKFRLCNSIFLRNPSLRKQK
jgi:hypothetical protein